jgi:hypothetical protein
MHQRSDLKNKEFRKTIQEAIESILFVPGDFHVALHMMVLIYNFCYGAFLQVFQTLINWKQITKLQQRRVNVLSTDKAKFAIPNAAFGWKTLHPSSQANTLHQFFKEYQASLRSKAKSEGDEVVLFLLNFMDIVQDHEHFKQGIQLGDYLTTKYLLVDWLYHWQAAGKHKYANVTLNDIDTLYGGTKGMLEVIRLYKFLRVSKGKGFFALDKVYELINEAAVILQHCPTKPSLESLKV